MKLTITPQGSGPCVKQTVTATIITPAGDEFTGTNHCLTPQMKCPREGMPSGVGYELCRTVCNQPAHAEPNAILLAVGIVGRNAVRGSTLRVEGHTYACDSCKAVARAAGIARLIVAGKEVQL